MCLTLSVVTDVETRIGLLLFERQWLAAADELAGWALAGIGVGAAFVALTDHLKLEPATLTAVDLTYPHFVTVCHYRFLSRKLVSPSIGFL